MIFWLTIVTLNIFGNPVTTHIPYNNYGACQEAMQQVIASAQDSNKQIITATCNGE